MTEIIDPSLTTTTTEPLNSETTPIDTSPTNITATSTDPITGSNSYSDSSNGNQIAVLSTLDYSSDQIVTYNEFNNTYVTNTTVYNSNPQPAPAQSPSAQSSPLAQPALQRSTYRFTFTSSDYFRAGRVDRIIGFSANAGDTLALSNQVFTGMDSIRFASISSRKALRRKATSIADIIYLQPSGKLYFNANGKDRGFGDDGGLFAVLEQAPMLTASQFTLL